MPKIKFKPMTFEEEFGPAEPREDEARLPSLRSIPSDKKQLKGLEVGQEVVLTLRGKITGIDIHSSARSKKQRAHFDLDLMESEIEKAGNKISELDRALDEDDEG